MASRSIFVAMPLDILHLIMFFCTVQDILMLRMCCSTLERVTRSRSIWAQALYTVKELTGACYLERDIHEMCQKKLEQAATTYLRFRKIAESQCVHSREGDSKDAIGSTLRPYISRILTQEGGHGAQHIDSMKLVPGGRYLITLSMQTLQFWDLGTNSESFLPNSPLATANCPFEEGTINYIPEEILPIDCYVEDDGTVQIMLTESGFPWTFLLRFEVVIGQSAAEFTLLGKSWADCETLCWFGRNMPTLWASELSGHIGVWDPKSRSAVQWKGTERTPPLKMAAYGGYLVYWHENHVSFARIPELSPLVSKKAEEIPEPEFYKIFWKPNTDKKESTVVLPPTQPLGSLMFEMVDVDHVSLDRLATLRNVILSYDQQASPPFSIVQRHQNEHADIEISKNEVAFPMSSFYYPDGYRLLFWLSSDDPPQRQPLAREPPRAPYISLFLSDITGEERPWSKVFLYIRTLDEDNYREENEIRIVDYVPPSL